MKFMAKHAVIFHLFFVDGILALVKVGLVMNDGLASILTSSCNRSANKLQTSVV